MICRTPALLSAHDHDPRRRAAGAVLGAARHLSVCGAHQVIHHPLGGPDPRLDEEDPPWVQWQGCVLAFSDRTCEDCGAGWNVEHDEDEEE